MVNGGLGNEEGREDGCASEGNSPPEDGRQAISRPHEGGDSGAGHHAGVIEGLVDAVPLVEARLPRHAQRQGRHDGQGHDAGDGGGDLAEEDDPHDGPQQDDERGQGDDEEARHDDPPLVPAVVDEGAQGGVGRQGHDAADGGDGAAQPRSPALLLEEDAQERAQALLHVSHEEAHGHQPPRGSLLYWREAVWRAIAVDDGPDSRLVSIDAAR